MNYAEQRRRRLNELAESLARHWVDTGDNGVENLITLAAKRRAEIYETRGDISEHFKSLLRRDAQRRARVVFE